MIRYIIWAILAVLIFGWAIRVLVPGCADKAGGVEVPEAKAPSISEMLDEASEAAKQESGTQDQAESGGSGESVSMSNDQEFVEGISISASEIPVHPDNKVSAQGTLLQLTALRVIDGDTLDASDGRRYRFYGVNTPERDGRNHERFGTSQSHEAKCYAEATARTKDLVEGKTIYVEPSERATGPNGRSLGYIYTEDGQSVDQILVEEGLARSWKQDGHHKTTLVFAEGEARINMTGCLWKAN